jgi:chitinase
VKTCRNLKRRWIVSYYLIVSSIISYFHQSQRIRFKSLFMMRSKYAWPLWFLSFTSATVSLNGTTNTLPGASENGSALYLPLFEQHSNSTPRFINSTGLTANPLIKALQAKNQDVRKRGLLGLRNPHGASRHSHHAHQVHKRADLPEGTCAPGTFCVNGACCSNKGICGYAPTECGTGNCISNCNATAPCGQYAISTEKNCPLNVCCSFFGFCGSTSEFCTMGGERPCQQGFGTCGDAPRPSCSGGDTTSKRVVGYYEGW